MNFRRSLFERRAGAIKNRDGIFAGGVVFLAYALRAYAVSRQALRGDEAFSLTFSSQSIGEIMRAMAYTEPNPPLYWLLLNGWMRAAGQSELAVRWPSVLAGVIAVALTYRLGRAMAGVRTGLSAALLVAVSPFLIWYSQDARVYSLLSALVVGAVWQTWEAARRNPTSRWLASGVLWWLAMFAHYFAVLPFVSVGFALLLTPQTRSRWRPAGGVALGVGLVYLPWALYVEPLLAGHTKAWISPPGVGEMFWRTLAAASAGTQAAGATSELQLIGVSLLTLFTGIGMWAAFRRDRGAAIWLLATGLGPPLALWLLSLARPAFTEQYLISSLPVMLILAAWGVSVLACVGRAGVWLIRIAFAVWLIAVLLALRNYFFNPDYAKSPNWRGVVAYLEQTARPEEVVVINLPDPAFFYYYRAPMPVETSPLAPLAEAGIPATEAQLQRLRDRFHHIRFFFSPSAGYDPDGFVGKWLEACCEKMADRFVYRFRVQTFDTPAGSLAARQAYPVEFEEDVTLTGYRVDSAEVQAGDTLHLTLYWTARAPIKTSYTVFVHFLAADGFDVAGADSLPAGGRRLTDQWGVGEAVIDPHLIPVPADAPPGEYGIEVGLYQLSTGERLPLVGAAGTVADAVKLPVTVRLTNP